MSIPIEDAEITGDNPVLRPAQVNNSQLPVTIPFGWTTTLRGHLPREGIFAVSPIMERYPSQREADIFDSCLVSR